MRFDTPTLETPRLLLRPLSARDVPAIQHHIDNPRVIGELSAQVPWPYPPDGAQQWFEGTVTKIEAGEAHVWVLVERAGNDEAIGVIDFRYQAGEAGHRGFWLAEPWWGRGLMTEATHAMQDWLFDVVGIPELITCNAAGNLCSRRIKQKSGAVKIGEFELEHHHHGSRTERWRLTAEAWRRFRAEHGADPM